ncbi:small multi-drug export protein [Patescibacteria group bacterium AH-259-L05]|nr:small multi-drug export protein [Patescibacteria group bacterium AH-259-L05]
MIPELKTILLAMTPINELRGTIPISITIFNLSVFKTFFLAVIGNMIPIFFLLWFWKALSKTLTRRSKAINHVVTWIFKRTRKRFYKKYSSYGDLALILLVAIPLPFTGAWTGTVAAFLFGIPYWRSLGLIFVGVLIAGFVVTMATLGIISII